MKSIFTKKALIIVSVVSFIVLGAVVLALATGNTYFPSLSDPNGVFYQRIDDDGNVLYEITNEDLFEEIKSNDGVQQLLYMTDSIILSDYINSVTDQEIADKILQLNYGTSDLTVIAEIDDDNKADLETAYEQSMILAGFKDQPEVYAKLLVAREKFVMDIAREDEVVADKDIAMQYLSSYFDDIKAIKIRFTSQADANAVLDKFNILSLTNDGLREYNGFVYSHEDLLDLNDDIVEAYKTIDTYYFDVDDNIVGTDGTTVYEIGANDVYTDADDKEYRIEPATDNLVNGLSEIIISSDVLFTTLTAAETYKENNSEYFTVSRLDPYDMDQTIEVKDSLDAVVYTIDPDGHIFDAGDNDVTYSTDLIVNKVYTAIEDVLTVTENNSTELTEAEVLQKYILMYNYVYGVYRDTLPEAATSADLIALDNEFLTFNFEDLYAASSMVADFMFTSLSIEDDFRYSINPSVLNTGNSSYYYMVYKITEPTKEDVLATMFDSIEETIVIPTTIGDTIVLPATSFYDSTITWSSSNSEVITNVGTVIAPSEDEDVNLTYTINVFGRTRINTINVTVLADGETVDVTVPEGTELTYQAIVNDAVAFTYLEDKLYDEYVYGTDANTNINNTLYAQRAELEFTINDYYLALDYSSSYSEYQFTGNGDKTVLASLSKTLTSEDPVEITADQYFEFALTKNAALYTLYATQFKELLYSPYFTEIFGEQTNLMKNKSSRMDEMYVNVSNAKEYYSYLQNLYAQYGMEFNFSSFNDYSYSQFNVKTELGLLEYFVSGELQPYLINETIENENVVEALYPIAQDNFDNYFSLDVNHLLVFIDFDEDGSPDNFDDYQDALTPAEFSAFEALQAGLEIAIDEYDGEFAALLTEFNNASREDETWGVYKQNGFFILTEDLNIEDSETEDVFHSLTYSGEYGVKDTFVPEYVDALVQLYQEYQEPQNFTKSELYSDFVPTQFGLHVIKVGQGDNFTKPSFEYSEEDSANPIHSVGIENDNADPTLAQLELYAQYKFYSMIYDLTDADIEDKFEITVPSIPATVSNALDMIFDDLLANVYVIGAINVNMSGRLESGTFLTTDYSTVTNAELMTSLAEVGGVYFDAIFGDYITD